MRKQLTSELLIFAAAFFIMPCGYCKAIYLTGAEVSKNADSLYLGKIASLSHDNYEPGSAYRLWINRTNYQYSENGTTHKATAYGLEAGVGYLFQTSSINGSGFANIVAQNTILNPDDLSNAARGSALTASVSGDLNYRLHDRWIAMLCANFTIRNHAHWSRLRIMRELYSPAAIGIESISQGDANYSISQAGVVFTGLQVGSFDFAFKTGTRKVNSESAAAYMGIEVSTSF